MDYGYSDKQIAGMFRRCKRAEDVAARIGLLKADGTPNNDAARKLRKRLRDAGYDAGMGKDGGRNKRAPGPLSGSEASHDL